MVSCMETGSAPSPREARDSLRQLGEDESAVRYPPLPRWFFVAMAAAMAGMHLAQLLSPSDASKATFALGIVTAVLGGRYWMFRDGVAWVSPKLSDMGLFLVAVLGVFGVCWIVAATTGAWWIWIVGAVAAGAVVLRTGHAYRQAFGDGR